MVFAMGAGVCGWEAEEGSQPKRYNTPCLVRLTGNPRQGPVIKALAAGSNHYLALGSDLRTLWAWGENTNGQLGIDRKSSGHHFPVKVAIPETLKSAGIQTIAASQCSLAQSMDGQVWLWGCCTWLLPTPAPFLRSHIPRGQEVNLTFAGSSLLVLRADGVLAAVSLTAPQPGAVQLVTDTAIGRFAAVTGGSTGLVAAITRGSFPFPIPTTPALPADQPGTGVPYRPAQPQPPFPVLWNHHSPPPAAATGQALTAARMFLGPPPRALTQPPHNLPSHLDDPRFSPQSNRPCQSCAELYKQLSAAREAIETTKTELNTFLNKYHEDLNQLAEALEEQKAVATEATSTLQRMEELAKMDNARVGSYAVDALVRLLKQEPPTWNLNSVRVKLRDAVERLNFLAADRQTKTRLLEQKQEELQELRQRSSSMATRLSDALATADEQRLQRQRLQTTSTQQTDALALERARRQECETEVHRLQAELQCLSLEHDKAKSLDEELQTLRRQLSEAKIDLTASGRERVALIEQRRSAQSLAKSAQDRAARGEEDCALLESKVHSLEARENMLLAQVRELTFAAAAAEGTAKSAQESLNAKDCEIASLEEELKQVQDRLESRSQAALDDLSRQHIKEAEIAEQQAATQEELRRTACALSRAQESLEKAMIDAEILRGECATAKQDAVTAAAAREEAQRHLTEARVEMQSRLMSLQERNGDLLQQLKDNNRVEEEHRETHTSQLLSWQQKAAEEAEMVADWRCKALALVSILRTTSLLPPDFDIDAPSPEDWSQQLRPTVAKVLEALRSVDTAAASTSPSAVSRAERAEMKCAALKEELLRVRGRMRQLQQRGAKDKLYADEETEVTTSTEKSLVFATPGIEQESD